MRWPSPRSWRRWPSTSCICPRRLIPYEVPAAGNAVPARLRRLPDPQHRLPVDDELRHRHDLGTKDDAIDQIERNSIGASDESPRYDLQVLARRATHPVQSPISSPTPMATSSSAPTPSDRLDLAVADGPPWSTTGRTSDDRRLRGAQPWGGPGRARCPDIDAFVVPTDQGDIVNQGFTEAVIEIRGARTTPRLDAIVDADGRVYQARGRIRSSPRTGHSDSPGLALQRRARQLRRHCSRPPSSTVRSSACWHGRRLRPRVCSPSRSPSAYCWRSCSTTPMRGQESVPIGTDLIPYAMPGFMTALVWRGMFNQTFGASTSGSVPTSTG